MRFPSRAARRATNRTHGAQYRLPGHRACFAPRIHTCHVTLTWCGGAQVELLRDETAAGQVRAAVLQAPVSDREYLATLPDTAARLATSLQRIAAGAGGDLLPLADDGAAHCTRCLCVSCSDAAPISFRIAGDTPITAARFASLAGEGGADDLFSSDLSEAALAAAVGHVSVPVLLVPSLADEYVPPGVDARALMARMASAMRRSPRVDVCAIEGAPHALATPAEIAQLVDAVLALLAQL
jgi:hypothetical protein